MHVGLSSTVEPRYNEVLWTMKITLLYQVSYYIRVNKQRNIKSWDQQNYLVIRGFCYIRPLYNEVPLYHIVIKYCSSSTEQSGNPLYFPFMIYDNMQCTCTYLKSVYIHIYFIKCNPFLLSQPVHTFNKQGMVYKIRL